MTVKVTLPVGQDKIEALNSGSTKQPTVQKQLENAVDYVVKSKRMLLVTGAGISTSAGIPDFRSTGGLYSSSSKEHKIKGKELFDIALFNDPATTSLYYTFMAELFEKSSKARSTSTHKFIKTLHSNGRLLRCYTQNIDGLERQEGLRLDHDNLKLNQVLQLHGDIQRLKCFLCASTFPQTEDYCRTFSLGQAPKCPVCEVKCATRVAAGRRAIAMGTLRPDVVLYGEQHPLAEVIGKACNADLLRKPDLLLITGTSLKVIGIKKLVKDAAKQVHANGGKVILVNKTELPQSEWGRVIDYHIESHSDDFVHELARRKPAFFLEQSTLDRIPRSKAVTCVKAINKENSQIKPLCKPQTGIKQPSSKPFSELCLNAPDLPVLSNLKRRCQNMEASQVIQRIKV